MEGGEAKKKLTPLQSAFRDSGLSIEQAAKETGICVKYAKRILAGRGACSYPVMLRLSRTLGCSGNAVIYSLHQGGSRKERAKAS